MTTRSLPFPTSLADALSALGLATRTIKFVLVETPLLGLWIAIRLGRRDR